MHYSETQRAANNIIKSNLVPGPKIEALSEYLIHYTRELSCETSLVKITRSSLPNAI